jgi:RHS repeat-associated protein
VNKATLTITASNASRAYGVPNPAFAYLPTGFVNGDTSSVLSGAPSLTTTATPTSAPGSYPITAAAGTLTAANYSFTFAAGTLTVTTASQTITFTPPTSPVTYGVSPITLSATSTSGLAVTFSVLSGPGTISGNTLTITAAGTVVVAANQAGNTDYAAAAQVTQSIIVNAATPTITWAIPAPITYGTALNGTQLNASLSVAGSCVYTPAAGMVLSAGTQTLSVTCTPTDTADYATPAADTVQLTISQAVPVINWTAPAAINSGTALSAAQLDATSIVSGVFSYTPASGTVLAAGTQTLKVTLTPTDSIDYATASATVPLTVNQATPTVSAWPTASGITYGQTLASSTLSGGTASVAGTFAWTTPTTAPGVGTAPQSVTFTPTDTTDYNTPAAGSASVMVSATQCASKNGYNYRRIIEIDHMKVSNTDQTNFPFLFNTTDPTLVLATATNGGHVTSPNGYDIIFSTDPNGLTKLDYELEKYNPATGQVIAWVRIPMLSHATDTVLYVFYGNSSITTPQQNPTGVWGDGYVAVYHLSDGTTLNLNNSASTANNLTNNGAGATSGEIDGGASFSGNQYAYTTSPSSLPTGTGARTLSAWVQMTTNNANEEIVGWGDNSGNGDRWSLWWNGSQMGVEGENVGASANMAYDTNWHYVALTSPNGNFSFANTGIYIDGMLQTLASSSGSINTVGSNLALGSIPGAMGIGNFQGNLDEVRISNMALSPGWIATEYNNQSSPSTFYSSSAENALILNPEFVILYSSQSEQFTGMSANSCAPSVIWSQSPLGLGMTTSTGLYTAPANIAAQETVTVTATSQADTTKRWNAFVTLLPVPSTSTLTLAAAGQPPYIIGTPRGFVATLTDQNGTSEPGAAVLFTVLGSNASVAKSITDDNGMAEYSYTGAYSGKDTIQATAIVSGQQLTANPVSISWIPPLSSNGSGGIALSPSSVPTLGLEGLCGAFTDSNGAVIEPLDIGAARKVFVVPAGATQLQLGVDDGIYFDNWGPGFVVNVNGVPVTVPAGAMPWLWVAGGLNSNYIFSIQDGTNPIIAATHLVPGTSVVVAYQSGLNSPGGNYAAIYNADGVPSAITGTGVGYGGVVNPTFYMTTLTYTVGTVVPVSAVVTNDSGLPVPTVSVTFSVAGANAQQFQATTDSTGTAAFPFTGVIAGTDTLEAQASLPGNTILSSTQTSIVWKNSTPLPPAGSLTLSPNKVQQMAPGGQQAFNVYAVDASGNPLSSVAVILTIENGSALYLNATTDATGHAAFTYQNFHTGTDLVRAVAFINDETTYSNFVSVPWTLPSIGGGTAAGTININISALPTVTLPNALQLNGTVTDSSLPAGSMLAIAWSQVSGPGTATFANPQQATTTAAFSQAGDYVLELSVNDSSNSGSMQIEITVNTAPGTQGWVGSPAYGATVSGVVPIMVAPGVTLQNGRLIYYPANSNGNVSTVVLNENATGSGQIGTLDTTVLANGSYWIQLQATDISGEQQYSLVMVTVSGNYKPGRVTATVTDLVVPATGLAINIQRTYDSLNAGTSGDFGYGWNLGINVNLTVDPKGDVTFTLGGQRKTFYLAPQKLGCSALIGCYFPYFFVVFTPEPGLYGTLTTSSSGCADGFDLLEADGFCQDGSQFNPPGYIYTDSNGTSYTISAAGNLQSIQDRSGNGLTITPNGITSTTGLSVPFARDAQNQNRITQITDPQGNIYQYGYDTNGNLATVTYPVSAQSTSACPGTTVSGTSTYTYDPTYIHLYAGGTDGRGCPLPTTAYYPSGATDANGNSLSGRLQSVQDALSETTSYAYILSTTSTINGVSVPNTGVTTITYPQDQADGNGAIATATMIYDSYGMLLSSEDPLKNTTLNTYDANHNLISTTDPLGNTTTSTYDQNGNKTSSTYPATPTSKNTTSYTYYNQYSEPTSTTDELGNVRAFNYDANYNPQSVTDSIGTLASFIFNSNQTLAAGAIGFDITSLPAMASQFAYDGSGNMTSRTDALGRTTSYVYNSLGQKTSIVTPTPASPTGGPGSTTSYTYDPFGNLTETAAPLNRTTSSTYDANGNKTSDTDALGNVTNYQYDALNRLIETDYPSNATTPATKSTKSYDFRNDVIDEIDQAGNDTHHEYGLAGRQTTVIRGYGSSTHSATSYAYDNDNRKTSETDANGNTTNYTYDADSRLTAISGVVGNFQYAYDDAGNRISSTDGKGNKTGFRYDARKRLIETDYPDGTSVKNTYDGPGNLASVTDQASNIVQYTYDAANQLATVVQHNSPIQPDLTNSYGYDNLGNLTGLTDARSNKTVNGFNVFNQPTSKLLPDDQLTESRSYDASGNLITLTHFNGVTTTYTYDALNRLLTRATPGESTVSCTYTATGKYNSSAVGSHIINYSYNALDQLTAKATPQGTLSYTYYPNGQVESIKSSNTGGASVSYAYDDLNRLISVVDNNLPGQNTTDYTYDPASNVATVKYPSGLTSTFTYDSLNRLTELSTTTTPADDYRYTLGLTGNRTNATEQSGRALAWNYDGIYRLTGETISGDPANNNVNNGSATYTLDPVGNRTAVNSTLNGINPISGSYNADDELSSETYDSNGNTTLAANGNSYTYDSENHMTSATGNGKTITMVYDAFGNRVGKTVNGVTTWYLVEDDVNPTGLPQVLEEKVGGAVQRVYTYGLQRISQYQFFDNQWTASFYVYDGAGSVRQLTDSTGTVTDEYEYDAYGNSFTKSGITPNNYLYRGEQFDPDLGLYYLRARYYNAETGRFMSIDPWNGNQFDPKTLHKYLYVGSNPVNYVDPRGRALFEYAIESNAAIPEAKLISIYGCVAGAALAAVDLILDPTITASSALGTGSAILGCVVLMPGLNELAEGGVKIAKTAKGVLEFVSTASGWGSCAADAEEFVNALNGLLLGSPNADAIGKSIEDLGGCVSSALGAMLKAEAE